MSLDRYFWSRMDSIAADVRPEYTHQPMDIVISGGGLASFYACGVLGLLHGLMKKKKVEIRRIFGASAGALSGALFFCSLETEMITVDFIYQMYQTMRRKMETGNMKVAEAFMECMREVLPSNAHELCSGRLFVTITECSWSGVERKCVSQFDSVDDLLTVLLCSSTIPFVTVQNVYTEWKGRKYVDGCIPLAPTTPYVYIDLLRLFYPIRLMMNPIDPSIILLMMKGFEDAIRFVYKGKSCRTLYWHHPMLYCEYKWMMIPIGVVVLYMIYRKWLRR